MANAGPGLTLLTRVQMYLEGVCKGGLCKSCVFKLFFVHLSRICECSQLHPKMFELAYLYGAFLSSRDLSPKI